MGIEASAFTRFFLQLCFALLALLCFTSAADRRAQDLATAAVQQTKELIAAADERARDLVAVTQQ